jgi:small subunit ribosomal protein S7
MRRRSAPKRNILPDPKYRSEMVAKFVNNLMLDGKKSIAENITYQAFDILTERLNLKNTTKSEDGGEGDKQNILQVFKRVLDNVSPTVEVRSRRVGGATYQIPMEVRPTRRSTLGMRSLIEAARQRREKGMVARLANEMLDALEGRGSAVKKRENIHQMAKANQAFAHFRW